jgi:hypothetical protein
VGIIQKFYALISKGEPADPEQPVELIVVRATSGPMTVARLRQDGFDATGYEEFNAGTKVAGQYVILVPRRELGRATARLKAIL